MPHPPGLADPRPPHPTARATVGGGGWAVVPVGGCSVVKVDAWNTTSGLGRVEILVTEGGVAGLRGLRVDLFVEPRGATRQCWSGRRKRCGGPNHRAAPLRPARLMSGGHARATLAGEWAGRRPGDAMIADKRPYHDAT
jgi:hypothetical protein